jgi:hypothetical protein
MLSAAKTARAGTAAIFVRVHAGGYIAPEAVGIDGC